MCSPEIEVMKFPNCESWYPRTTDAQRENSLHCTAKNSIPIPNFQVRPKHILSATFCKKSLRKNAMVEHFFLHKKVPIVLYRYFFVKKKVFNYSELHFSEVTSYKIHSLIVYQYSNWDGNCVPQSINATNIHYQTELRLQ